MKQCLLTIVLLHQCALPCTLMSNTFDMNHVLSSLRLACLWDPARLWLPRSKQHCHKSGTNTEEKCEALLFTIASLHNQIISHQFPSSLVMECFCRLCPDKTLCMDLWFHSVWRCFIQAFLHQLLLAFNIERSFFALRHSEKYSTLLSSTHRSSLIPRGTAHSARRFSEGPSCTGLFYCAAALQRFFLAPLSQQLGRLAKVQPRSDPPEPDCQATSLQKTNCTERIRSHIDIQQIEQVRQFQRFLCKVTSRLQTLRVKNGIKYVNINIYIYCHVDSYGFFMFFHHISHAMMPVYSCNTQMWLRAPQMQSLAQWLVGRWPVKIATVGTASFGQ